MKTIITISYSLFFLMSTGCASIISGSEQEISLTSQPSGATVTVEPGGQQATTPGTLLLKRKDGPYRLNFTLDGHEPYSVMLTTDMNGWVYGNLILGGIIGFLIDSSTGASTTLNPDEVNANLVKVGIEPQTSSDDMIIEFSDDSGLLGIVE